MSLSKSVKLSSKSQIALPADIRRELGVGPGDRIVLTVRGDEVVLMTPEAFAKATSGLLRGTWGADRQEIDRYLERERESWK